MPYAWRKWRGERAWDADGVFVGDAKPVRRPKTLDVTHTGTCECGGTYQCPRCGRHVGWCFGAADEYSDVCDDCWAEMQPGEAKEA